MANTMTTYGPGPSEAALERCALVRAALLEGAKTRQEIKAETGMGRADLNSAMLRCWRGGMTSLVPRVGDRPVFALTDFGRRIAEEAEQDG